MKDAYYFSHDSNAWHDPKILALRSVYGVEGYGRYWIIIEMMREADGYRLENGKYMRNALAMQMQCTVEQADKFITDCINEFELFKQTDGYFWSESLLRRMEKLDNVREQRSLAAHARWDKSANAMQKQSNRNANAMQNDAKESKVKKSKVKYTTVHLLFDAFWKAYPRKKSRGQAEITFAKIDPDEQLLATMLTKIEQLKKSEDWQDMKYIPYPSTWLNDKGWEDVIANSSPEDKEWNPRG